MEGKITKDGILVIKRAEKWKGQICPFKTYPSLPLQERRCGDECPLFSEPYKGTTIIDGEVVYTYTLDLCGGEWTFNRFEDERVVL